MIDEVYCQSCGNLMKNGKDYGSESDGRKSKTYCKSCYQNGEFLEKDLNLEQMVVRATEQMQLKKNINESQAYSFASMTIKNLKRWSETI